MPSSRAVSNSPDYDVHAKKPHNRAAKINSPFQLEDAFSSVKATAKLFRNGRSQAVRLPKAFQFEGKEVRVSRTAAGGVLLEPMRSESEDWDAFFARMEELDRKFGPVDFVREQPPMPDASPELKAFFDID